MFDNLLAWIADWRHLAFLLAAIVLLYLARDAAHGLLRTTFQFAAHALRLLDRWIHGAAERVLAGPNRDDAGIRFVFALILTAAVGVAGWLNFALLERPMAEIVGDSYRVMGLPIYRLAALAIIVLEVAVGMVLLEAVGGTSMFPQLERLDQKPKLRLAIVITLATALVVLACIEAALALTRDEITRLERELMGTLAGAQPLQGAQTVGDIARYAQAAFGFVIPFALAFLGFAIEMLVRNGRAVLQFAVGTLLHVLAFFFRLLRRIVLGGLAVALALYDFAIFLPVAIEKHVRRVRP